MRKTKLRGQWLLKNGVVYFLAQDHLAACYFSVSKLCLTLCYPMDYSMTGFSVPHYLREFVQSHVHWFSHAIQPSHPLSSPSPPLNLAPLLRKIPTSKSLTRPRALRVETAPLPLPFPSLLRENLKSKFNALAGCTVLEVSLHSCTQTHWCLASPVALGTIWLTIVLTFLLWKGFFWEISRICLVLLMWLLIPTPALLNSLISLRICQ